MNIFEEIKNRLQSVIDKTDEMLVKAMVANKEEIIDLNVSQLEQGINSEGLSITPEYESEAYAALKQSMGSKAPLGTPDLKLEGDFQSGIYADEFISGTKGMSGLMMDSHDAKADKLSAKYSDTYGLTPQNVGEVKDPIIENYQKQLIDELTR